LCSATGRKSELVPCNDYRDAVSTIAVKTSSTRLGGIRRLIVRAQDLAIDASSTMSFAVAAKEAVAVLRRSQRTSALTLPW
jgi:hypothetical protein